MKHLCCSRDCEIIDHIVRDCTEIRPPQGGGTLAEALGFRVGGSLNFRVIAEIKRRLKFCWMKKREQMGT